MSCPVWVLGTQLSPLQEQQVLWTTSPSATAASYFKPRQNQTKEILSYISVSVVGAEIPLGCGSGMRSATVKVALGISSAATGFALTVGFEVAPTMSSNQHSPRPVWQMLGTWKPEAPSGVGLRHGHSALAFLSLPGVSWGSLLKRCSTDQWLFKTFAFLGLDWSHTCELPFSLLRVPGAHFHVHS